LSLIKDTHHIGVRQPGSRSRFLNEATREGGVVREVTVHYLDGYASLEPQVSREVNRCHSTAGDALIYLITTVDKSSNQDVTGRGIHSHEFRQRVCELAGAKHTKNLSVTVIADSRRS
jgi:hypothetical protein